MSQVPTNSPFIQPSAETLRHVTERTVIEKDAFLQLPDELRMRAFTIARQTEANVLQDTLDAIRQHVSEGGTMWTFREKFPEIVAPYTAAGRDWHLQLVVQQNTRQALAVGSYQQRQKVKRAFPYVEYQAGINPRPSHEALDGKIFAVDDPFLHTHTPPWEHGCNCDLISRTAAQAGRAEPADFVPGNPGLESQLSRNKIDDGGGHPIDLTPPIEKPVDEGDSYSFRPDRINQPLDLSKYGPEIRARLVAQLQQYGYRLAADGLSAVPVGGMTAMKTTGKVSQRTQRAPSRRIGATMTAMKRVAISEAPSSPRRVSVGSVSSVRTRIGPVMKRRAA